MASTFAGKFSNNNASLPPYSMKFANKDPCRGTAHLSKNCLQCKYSDNDYKVSPNLHRRLSCHSEVFSTTCRCVNDEKNAENTESAFCHRYKERDDMRQLNEKLADHIEKVKFWEAQNKNLNRLLEKLRNQDCNDNAVLKNYCSSELAELQKRLNDTQNEKKALAEPANQAEDSQLAESKRRKSLSDANQEDKDKIENLNRQISHYDAELRFLQRQADVMDQCNQELNIQNVALRERIKQHQLDIEEDNMKQWQAEAAVMKFQNAIGEFNDSIDKEIQAIMSDLCQDPTDQNRDQWKREMSKSLHRLQEEHDKKLEKTLCQLDSKYSLQLHGLCLKKSRSNFELHQLADQNKKLMSQIKFIEEQLPILEEENSSMCKVLTELQGHSVEEQACDQEEMNLLTSELQANNAEILKLQKNLECLLDEKLSLEKEISCYRHLLDAPKSSCKVN